MGALIRGSLVGMGDGYGYSYGYGYGYGYGDGYGYGSGSGYGSGYGSGDGSGDGYGYGPYWAETIKYFSAKWPASQRKRMSELKKSGARVAFWRSGGDGRACNGGTNSPVVPGTVETTAGPLILCKKGALHATLIPPKWKGERWWVVALIGDVIGDDEKYAALTREIIGECL